MGWLLVFVVVIPAALVLGYARARSLKTLLVTLSVVGLALGGLGTWLFLFPKDTTEARLVLFGEPDAVLLVHTLWRPAKGAPDESWHSIDPATGALLGEVETSGIFSDVAGDPSPFGAHLLGADRKGRPLLLDPQSLTIAVSADEMARRLAERWPGARTVVRVGKKIEATLANGSRVSVSSLDGKESSWREGTRETLSLPRLPAVGGGWHSLVQPTLTVMGDEEVLVVAHEVAGRPETRYFARLVRRADRFELAWRRPFTELGLADGTLDGVLPAGEQVLVACRGRPPGTWGWHAYFGNTFRFVMSLDRNDGTVRWATRL
jgi:hypothetical protein